MNLTVHGCYLMSDKVEGSVNSEITFTPRLENHFEFRIIRVSFQSSTTATLVYNTFDGSSEQCDSKNLKFCG